MRDGPEATDTALTIYSPSPPSIMLHEHNLELGAALETCGLANSIAAVALPESINQLAEMSTGEKAHHWPIVTTIDFLPAIGGGGPEWHAYQVRNPDLKFVSSLHDVAFGVLAFDKGIQSPDDLRGRRIAAPPRPSAVRVFTEALLRDGWGIVDDVEVIDVPPPELAAALAKGHVDATTWSLMSRTATGFRPMMPPLLERAGAHWIGIQASVVAAINAANEFKVESTEVPPIEPGDGKETSMQLLSFRQALTAWESTPHETVKAVLECIELAGPTSEALPRSPEEMTRWPMISNDLIHEAALDFYRERGR